MKEEWRPVTFLEYAHLYHVSNLGRVKSLRRVGNRTGGILAANPQTRGYPSVQLRNKGKSKTITVHKLVANAFLGERPSSFEIDHIDHNKTNNTVDNLRYVSHQDNMSNRIFDGKLMSAAERISDHAGVNWFKRNQKWGATVYSGSERHFLGLFEKEQDAINAHVLASKEIKG